VLVWADISDVGAATSINVNTAAPGNAEVSRVAWAPDSDLVASGSEIGSVALFRFSTGDEQEINVRVDDPTPMDGVISLAFSQDGSRLGVSFKGGDVVLWDIGNSSSAVTVWKRISLPKSVNGGPDWFNVHVWSRDLTKLAGTQSFSADIVLLHVDSGEVQLLKGHNTPVEGLVWSPGQEFLASVSLPPNGAIRTWVGLGTGRKPSTNLLGTLAGLSHPTSIGFSPDGARVGVSTADNVMIVLNLVTYESVKAELTALVKGNMSLTVADLVTLKLQKDILGVMVDDNEA
jgi:WD40 repeat protein